MSFKDIYYELISRWSVNITVWLMLFEMPIAEFLKSTYLSLFEIHIYYGILLTIIFAVLAKIEQKYNKRIENKFISRNPIYGIPAIIVFIFTINFMIFSIVGSIILLFE